MTALVVNGITLALLFYSWRQNRAKTKKALQIAYQKGKSLAPMTIVILLIIGLLLALFPPALIQRYLGGDGGFWQVLLSAAMGALVMIPSLIAFPLAGSLINAGAAYTPIAAFVTTLTMVGFASLPLEMQEMGKKLTLWRNLSALVSALIIAILMGLILK